ncbi:hypothetical protein CBFG_03903 [Clostridiales bacterium 1_7_47FAA]|nr:hypothetical protein CBFG_03903 [Clostridiales bacterium 1_7_47FAA]
MLDCDCRRMKDYGKRMEKRKEKGLGAYVCHHLHIRFLLFGRSLLRGGVSGRLCRNRQRQCKSSST